MPLYAGIDCGTQGTKVVIIDTEQGLTLGEGSAPHEMISNSSGRREQHAHWWVDALCLAFGRAVSAAGIAPADIAAISVSGQQHGFVPLDRQGRVLRPVKLWCDTETAGENDRLLALLGGVEGSIEHLGLMVATGYTASKILWLKEHHPDLWQQLATVLLPHDYLNFWLTGNRVAEYGDASGSGLFDVRKRGWDRHTVDLIDDSGRLWDALPPLVSADSLIGTVCPEAAGRLGVKTTTRVASGGGDNMMGAIGTGNTQPGRVTMSLGTSGTLFAYSDTPVVSDSAMIAGFCSSSNGWLPLICTMNVTSATSALQKLFKQDLVRFNQALEQSEIGAGGILMLPFFNGERVPALPYAKASLHNMDTDNFTEDNLCRAVVESATFGLRYGMDLFRKQGIKATEIRLIGGGAKSRHWRQMVADIMDCRVVCLRQNETAALGAAIQAAWCDGLHPASSSGNAGLSAPERLSELCEQFVQLDDSTLTRPIPGQKQRYEGLYANYLELLNKEYAEVDL